MGPIPEDVEHEGERFIGTKIIHAKFCKAWERRVNYDIGAPGYKVTYESGYVSWSPQAVFEAAYRPIDSMTFGLAIEAMRIGNKVARKGWNGKGIYIKIQVPNDNSKMTSPYIFIDTTGLQTNNENAPKNRVPWAPSQTDMLATDWVIVE